MGWIFHAEHIFADVRPELLEDVGARGDNGLCGEVLGGFAEAAFGGGVVEVRQSGFGGVTETHLLHELFAEVYRNARHWHPRVVDPYAARARLLETVAAERSRERSVVIVGDPADHGDDTSERLFELEVRALRERGFRADC